MSRPPNLSKAARAMGRKGGKSGVGASKIRGDHAYYSAIGKKGRDIRLKQQKQKTQENIH